MLAPPVAMDVDEATARPRIGFLRFYEPNLQRWINRDPIEEEGDLNLYTLVGSDPINRVDPVGLQIVVPVPGPGQKGRPIYWPRNQP